MFAAAILTLARAPMIGPQQQPTAVIMRKEEIVMLICLHGDIRAGP